MQRFLQRFQVGAFFAIAVVSVIQAETNAEYTKKIQQACQSAQIKTKIQEPASVLKCQNQNIFPRQKRKQLDARVGLLEERVDAFSKKPDKAPAFAILDERIAALKKRLGIESEIEYRLLMTPIERAKYDKNRLVDLRKSLVQLKKQLGHEQKELANAYRCLIREEKKAIPLKKKLALQTRTLKQSIKSQYSPHTLRKKIETRQKDLATLKHKLVKTSKKSSVPENVNSIIQDIQKKLRTTQEGLDSLKKRLAQGPHIPEEIQANLYQLIASPKQFEKLAHNIIQKHGQAQNKRFKRHNMEIRS